ncbi:integral membrane sensor signal transduction histidine kinase [Gloeothece citriformis PCC 7424]|uniref:histidine kinase n=1 Tax=Gloeothece citriformis (strain PCC 7424) TaxID=65393 RepID=B7KJ63_GLOC7|nr:ATP-binding protein [Gloeothece citriformis]ACK72147.1 integral membrane sensor signal transduction histidine kinase [Gloeothece citriformis PCC 7424]
MPLKWNSIHAKLLATYLVLIALGTFLLGGYLLWSFYIFFMNMKQTELEIWSNILSEDIGEALYRNNLEQVQGLVKRYGSPETITLRIFNPQGRLLSTSAPKIDRMIKDWSVIPGMKGAIQNKTVNGVAKGVLSNEDRVYTVRPIIYQGQRLGIIRMSVTITQFQRQFRSLLVTVLGTVMLTFLLCAVISAWLARSLALPILEMRNFAVRLGSGHLGENIYISRGDELGQLASELNRMSELLASVERERRAFLANVSHELRTPVSNVKVTLEALSIGAASEPELCDRFIQTAQNEINRLSRLIQDLLDLGRLEAGVAPLEIQSVSLRSLINRAIEAIELRTFHHGVNINNDVPDLELNVDSERMLQALLNILENAIKYSPPGSTVSLMGYTENNQKIIQIKDEGIGIKPEALPHIFEEFYRSDSSRQSDGTGLGLAISQRIIKAHGGTITADSVLGEGTTIIISFPK